MKQRVASCHTAEVISIQSLPAPPPTQRGQAISEVGGDPHHVWYECARIATDWCYCFRFSDFHRIREWLGSKCRLWVRKSAKSGVFRPSILGGNYEHPHRRQTVTGHTASCGKVSRKSAQGPQKSAVGKKEKITTKSDERATKNLRVVVRAAQWVISNYMWHGSTTWCPPTRLESAEVGKKSPNCGAYFRLSKCRGYI